MICKSCGKEINDNAKFCSGCGTVTEEANKESNMKNHTMQELKNVEAPEAKEGKSIKDD